MSRTIYAVSVDCPNLIQLAFDLGMQTAQPGIWTALQSDCCTASGVTCFGIQRVTQISWNNLGLNGTINGTAIPSSVIILSLYANAIKGNIPLQLPVGLLHLELYRNTITGSIPSMLPIGLLALYLHDNLMSGNLPSFPSTLQYLFLGYFGYPGNRFTGNVRLNRPIQLYINDNWITDVFIQDSSQIYPSYCDLSNNPLLGNSNIAGLTMCTKDGLYSAALLPITRSTLITMTLETTTERTTNFGRTTVQQLSVSEMLATGTSTTTSSMGTVQFVQEMRGIVVNLGMMLRCIVSTMILSVVFVKTPFKREFKKMRSKRKTTTTTSGLDF